MNRADCFSYEKRSRSFVRVVSTYGYHSCTFISGRNNQLKVNKLGAFDVF